jgi:hypothetical protein
LISAPRAISVIVGVFQLIAFPPSEFFRGFDDPRPHSSEPAIRSNLSFLYKALFKTPDHRPRNTTKEALSAARRL